MTITAAASLCDPIHASAVIYAMPEGATTVFNAWPQMLAKKESFTIKDPSVTTITFHKGCLPSQFDIVTGETPPKIFPIIGPFHGPLLFPNSSALWFGSDCSGTGGCETYTPTNLAVKPSSVAPGDTITVSGSGVPGTTITIAFRQPPAAAVPTGVTVKVPANGQWSVPVTVPASLQPGTWQVVAGVEGCEVSATADISVTKPTTPTNPTVPSDVAGTTTIAPTTTSPASTQPMPTSAVQGSTQTNTDSSQASGLAFTGSSVRVPILIGVLLLVAGTLLVLQHRRRRS